MWQLWQPMVAKVSLFQVADVPTNWDDFTLRNRRNDRRGLTSDYLTQRVVLCLKKDKIRKRVLGLLNQVFIYYWTIF